MLLLNLAVGLKVGAGSPRSLRHDQNTRTGGRTMITMSFVTAALLFAWGFSPS
jgi:hypothetical protein